MEKWDKHQRKQHHSENPSFSSTLLDVIYRSIDEGTQTKEKEEQLIFYRETMRKQQNREDAFFGVGVEAEKPSFRRAKRVENWMETKTKEKPIMGRNSLTELERRTRSNSNTLSMHSSSSSSESSSIGGFSSSESESFYGVHKPKPIRTSVSYEKTNLEENKKPKHHENNNNSFGKTKSKALRILYGDMKKAKPPVSPGARLASFLNSLFTSNANAKKAKVSSSPSSSSSCVHEVSISKSSAAAQPPSSSSSSSTCSTVSSSFSRSCLSKTPSSRSGAKRSVRFCPVSVIVDEDCRPCGHKNLHEGEEENTMKVMKSYGNSSSSSKEELRFHVMQESRRVEELARELLKNYQKKNGEDFNLMDCDEEEDDDDAASCSSSDLFELDNLSAIGIERYREELPVYETTHFSTNRAIANGFIM